MSHQCEPISRHAARSGPVGLRIDAPVPVRVVEQPVLRISALHDQDLAEFARLAHAAHLLHHRVEAQIVAGRSCEAAFAVASLDQFAAASAAEIASGFSQITCLPAVERRCAMGKCSAFGVQMWTASMSGSSRTAR